MTGTSERSTNGIATSVWAIGISTADVRRSSGGSSSVTMNPKPSTTADVPNGSITAVSSSDASQPRR